MTDQPEPGPSFEAGRYARVLRRRWVTVLLLTVLGLAVAVAFLQLRPRQATASALVTVSAISAEPFNTTRQPSTLIDPQTELQTARSSAVVSRTADALPGDPTDAEVRRALKVTLFTNATVLRISYTGDSAQEAIEGADEAARQFLAYRGELAADKLGAMTEQLTKRRDLLRGDLVRVNQQLSKAGGRGSVQARSDRQLLSLELDSLVSQLNAVSGIDTDGGTVLTTAQDSGAYFAPSRSIVLGSGLLAGLVLGLVAAFVRNAVDRRVRDEHDVRAAGVGPVLARLRRREERLPPQEEDLDAVRSAWQRLQPVLPEHGAVLTLVDLGSAKAPSALPAAMALALARAGHSVELVLVEHPLQFVRSLSLHLDLARIEGGGVVERLQSSRHPELLVSVVTRSADSDSAEELGRLLAGTERPLRTTVVALPSNASRAARLAATRLAHGTVLVAEHHAARTDVLHDLAEEVREVGAHIAGTILVPAGHRLAPGREDTWAEPAEVPAEQAVGASSGTLSPPVGRR